MCLRLLTLCFMGLVGCAAAAAPSTPESTAPPIETARAAAPIDLVNVAQPLPSEAPVESATPRHADRGPGTTPEEHVDGDGLGVTDVRIGTGPMVVSGATVVVHYEGRLESGEIFDSSMTRSNPFEFVIGKGFVIQGWERGLLGMRVGGHRKLVIPPALGYGLRGSPPKIPPNARLIFEIDLLGVR